MQDIALEHLRADRVLQEALAVDADPLYLAKAFALSTQTAIEYSEIARNLLTRPIENPPTGLDYGTPLGGGPSTSMPRHKSGSRRTPRDSGPGD